MVETDGSSQVSPVGEPLETPEGPAAPPPAAREAAAAGSRRFRTALLAILLAAAATRFWNLGERPLHHDESIHAYQSYTLSQNGQWRYDPAYHGPFLYYANAIVYKTFGASDTTARLLPAAFGILLVAFAFPLRRWIGEGAAAAYALLVLLSPHLSYFSRFIREDLYSVVFTLATILAFRRFLETDRARWLTAAAVVFALAGVTKENAYMTGVLFVAFGLWTLGTRALSGPSRGAAFREALRHSAAWARARFPALLTAGIVFLSIWTLMYTAFGRHPGDWLAIPKAVKYWMGQHAIARIPGPWYYYFPQLLYYETATVAAAAFAFRKWKRDPFLAFWAFWAVASLAIYSWAREKVPWLTVHPLLPLTVLAALGLANLWRDRKERLPRLALPAIAVLLAVNAGAAYLACFRYGAYDLEREPRHGEYQAYVQTTEDLIRALGVLERVRPRVPEGQPLLTVAGEASWPLTWYLRDVPTTWTSRIDRASTPVIVADWDPNGALEKQLADKYDARRVPIRAWWFPERTGSTPERPGHHPTLREAWRWWLFHELWSPIGSQDSTFFVRKDLGAGSGTLEPLQLPVQDTTVKDYPADAALLAPERVVGGPGTAPGELAEPRGLAVDGRGNLYVADTKNSRIQVFDPDGKFLRAFGRKGAGDGELNEPCGITVDSDGEVWVADTWNHRIARFSPEGAFRGAFVERDRSLFGPRALVFSRGQLYVADTGNKRIVRFDRDGRKTAEFGEGGNGPGQLVEPVGLAADASGNLVVADTGNHRVQVFDPEGKLLRQFPVNGWKDFYTEPYLAIGPGDAVIATDAWGGRIAVYDAAGALRKSFRAGAEFKQPTGIAVDPFGRLNVSDRGTHRVFSWTLSSALQ
ncbi:MAG: flippase activity-associated protein Agl23 [Thermoanaerobaculia bacterium]